MSINSRRLMQALMMCFVAASAAWGMSPEWQKVLPMVKSNPRAILFGDAVKFSSVTSADFNNAYITFVAPQDSSCKKANREILGNLKSIEQAKAYVLDHAFIGQMSLYQEGGILKSVNYIPDVGRIGEHILVDENHPLTLTLLSGRSLIVSVKGKKVFFGAALAVDNMVYAAMDGGEVEVASCDSL